MADWKSPHIRGFESERLPGKPPRLGFILLVAEFGKIDNSRREDMLAMLREYLARAEGRYHEPEKGTPQ
jgi:hypothetical protein